MLRGADDVGVDAVPALRPGRGYLRERGDSMPSLNGVVTENVEGAGPSMLRLGAAGPGRRGDRRRPCGRDVHPGAAGAVVLAGGVRPISPRSRAPCCGRWLVWPGHHQRRRSPPSRLRPAGWPTRLASCSPGSTRSSSPRPRRRGSSGSPRCPGPGHRRGAGRATRRLRRATPYRGRARRPARRRRCDLRPGERPVIVGPSGAGKSTGRLLAGIDVRPPDGVGRRRARWSTRPDRFRGEVALVTQSTTSSSGTLAENLRLAKPDAPDAELPRRSWYMVDAHDWRSRCRAGSARSGGATCARASPSNWRWLACAARPAHPRPDEVTSLLDPRAARHLFERSLAVVVSGRTVVAIAHRLHTAHDADRSPSRTGRSPRSAPTTSWSPPTARMPRSGARGGTSRRTSVPPRADDPHRRGWRCAGTGTATVRCYATAVPVCHGNSMADPEQPWQVGSAQGGGQRARPQRCRDHAVAAG